jgi:Ubiquitin-protein ligase
LGRHLSLNDLEDVDPDLANGLRYILENDANDLGLTFTYETKIFEDLVMKELIPGGSEIYVDNENKKDYVKKFCEAKMITEIEAELQAFLKGFRTLLPIGYLSHFSPGELELMIAGVQKLNLDELKANSIYINCNKESELAKWFWELLEELSDEERSNFLFFISGIFLNL